MKNYPHNTTVGELRRDLAAYSDDDELFLSGLSYYRLKHRGEGLVQLEFNEAVYRLNTGELVAVDPSIGDHDLEISVRTEPGPEGDEEIIPYSYDLHVEASWPSGARG